jgi:hypothetical protein
MMAEVSNEAMHRKSGKGICLRFGWLLVPLIGDLDRSASGSILGQLSSNKL